MAFKIPSTIEDLFVEGQVFFEKLDEVDTGRFRSWEYCYENFKKSKEEQSYKNEEIKDLLALNLAFYLASWGMYRGSSFLLQRDYKVHSDIIDILFDDTFNNLWGENQRGITSREYLDNNYENIDLLVTMKDKLSTYYSGIKQQVNQERAEEAKRLLIKNGLAANINSLVPKKDDISDTLVTKILMGTLGCIPAFDRFFIDGIKAFNNKYTRDDMPKFYNSLGKKCGSVKWIATLFMQFNDKLPIKKTKNYHYEYPEMKIIDSCFWQLGFDIAASEKEIKNKFQRAK